MSQSQLKVFFKKSGLKWLLEVLFGRFGKNSPPTPELWMKE
jgi:hypothetical protein